jgi:hypothetical protein
MMNQFPGCNAALEIVPRVTLGTTFKTPNATVSWCRGGLAGGAALVHELVQLGS